jgi:hypothetical protein
MDTLPLDFTPEKQPKPGKPPRAKRPRTRKVIALATGKVQETAPPALLKAPQARVCGFCGYRETVVGEAAVCPQCGAIMVREE